MLFSGTHDNTLCKNTKDIAELKSDTKELASKCKEASGLLTNFPYSWFLALGMHRNNIFWKSMTK